jgi:hypothetical protein
MSLRLSVVLALALCSSTARADGEVMFRGAYYKERSTRVQQPMVDAKLDVGEHGELDAHFLVDVITSASVSAGQDGAEFREVRYENGASYLHDFGRFRLGGGYRLSTEPDYVSAFGTLRGEVSLADKNTVIGGTFAAGHDAFDDGNASGMGSKSGKMKTTLGSLSVSQLLSPLVVAGVTYDLSWVRGDQENLYRQVPVGDPLGLSDESVPDRRLRHALFGSVRGFVEPSRTTIVLGYRYYQDDWKVRAHTPEARVIQDFGGGIAARLRYRYYRQTAAEFYQTIYDVEQPLMTSDPKLSQFETQTVGVSVWAPLSRLGVEGNPGKVRAQLLVDYIHQTNAFGDAVAAQVAFTMPLEF